MSDRTYNILLAVLITTACVIGAVLMYVIYRSVAQPPATPTPVPTAVVPSGNDEAWQRIQGSGILRAGTSADYPPFAFRTAEFELDGLDIALIREIGRRLGLAVELNDMAFDGLGGALQIEQIDVAVAAISITPERSEMFDFSDVYFVSEDAVLAREDSTIPPITRVEDLARFRVGVERGTVYSNWLTQSLIDPGLMPASQLNQYEDISFAVRDLRDGRIDLVVLDLPPAEVAVNQGGVKINGQGLNVQFFAIGLPKGEPTLQGQINTVLGQMVADGSLAALVEKYVGVALQPLPTAVPTALPTAPPLFTPTPLPCVDGMEFVADLNLDDRNMTAPPQMAPGQPFRKGWRIRNSGTCTWDSRYTLNPDGGNSPAASMGGRTTPIQGVVPPGGEYDMYVDLVAPFSPGIYQGFWVMRNPANLRFGNRLWVGIEVPSPPTATPPPTQTPSPGIVFTVDRTQIFAGECVTFRWSVTNVQAVYFYEQGLPWQQHQVAPIGSSVECPPSTTVYNLRVLKRDNTVEVREITIFVQPKPGAPVIDRFTVDPPNQILLGQCVDITWQVSGNVTTVKLQRDSTMLWDGAPVSGTTQDCPRSVGQATYVLEASGPGGTSRLQRAVTVVAPPPLSTPTPLPSPTPPIPATPTTAPPVIYAFALNPQQIEAGQCTTVSWQVGGGDITKITISRDGTILLDNAPYSGREQDCLSDSGNYTYRLDVEGRNGLSDFSQQTLTVTEPPPSGLPLVGTTWFLQSYFDGAAQVGMIAGTSITAVFDAAGTLSGSAGCNTYTAGYSASDVTMTIGPPVQTQLICASPEGIMVQEQAYLSSLPNAAAYDITDSTLTIYSRTRGVVAQYQARRQ
jgi:polar amino acid transport system substrate-binding protein